MTQKAKQNIFKGTKIAIFWVETDSFASKLKRQDENNLFLIRITVRMPINRM